MKTTSEIEIGKDYNCKVRGKWSVVRVKEIDKSGYKNHSTVRILCVEESTGKQVIVRAPSKLSDPKEDPETDPDWSRKCENCGQSPIVPCTRMCGPCTFGEAETMGGNW